ncbi:MAG: DegT/DnrJ/EryC1/StrS family aminotransferase [Gammaproteobacteria bacterium]
MRIGRTLPPAAAPIRVRDLVSGIRGVFRGEKEIDRFRSELTEYFGMKHCFLVSSGKAAFTLILLALRELYPAREEVLIPAFTCYSAPSSIVRSGFTIRLCDLQPANLDFDFAQLSEMLLSSAFTSRGVDTLLHLGITDSPGETSGNVGRSTDPTKRLLAVVPTHLFGIPADVPKLRSVVRDPEVTIVEDAAQAMGETWDGKKLGTLGDVSFFSLGRGKAFSTVEGGIILTNRDDIAAKLMHVVSGLSAYNSREVLALFLKTVALSMFLHPLLFWIPRSIPSLRLGETLFEPHFPIRRMSSYQAGLARHWRKRLLELHDGREKNVNRWIDILKSQGIWQQHCQNWQGRGLIRFPVKYSNVEYREFILKECVKRGLGVMPVYPDSIGGIPDLQSQIGARNFPIADSCTRELITLPTHAYLTERDVMEISGLLFDAVSTART